MGVTRVVKRLAERVDVPQKMVRERTTAYQAGGEARVHVRSDWIPLYDIGARQTASGVMVKTRGSYRHAFIAGMKSGHVGVFRRTTSRRLPIREQFGPNPANDIVSSPDVYEQLLVDVATTHVMPRMPHELGRILPK